MADKQITDLVSATSIGATDLFVLEQGGVAKKLTGQILINWMTSYADGHGGIQSITWTTSGTSGNGQLHTATIHYADATTSTFSVRDGYKGDKGNTWYVYIRYAAKQPTANSDMGTTPDKWIGVYCGTSATAPTSYTSYTWYQWKGDKGDTGNPATIQSQSVAYQAAANGRVVPTGAWSSTLPTVAPGNYLWTRVTINFNSGNPLVYYAVAYNGVNGTGAVATVNSQNPDGNGNVTLSASNINTTDGTVQSNLDSLDTRTETLETNVFSLQGNVSDLQTYEVRHVSTSITSLPKTLSYSWVTTRHRIINCVFGTPSALTSDLTWATNAGSIVLSGTLASGSSTTVDFDIVKTV